MLFPPGTLPGIAGAVDALPVLPTRLGGGAAISDTRPGGGLATLLSLTIGDGLGAGAFHVWPLLVGLQVAVALALVGRVTSAQLTLALSARPDNS